MDARAWQFTAPPSAGRLAEGQNSDAPHGKPTAPAALWQVPVAAGAPVWLRPEEGAPCRGVLLSQTERGLVVDGELAGEAPWRSRLVESQAVLVTIGPDLFPLEAEGLLLGVGPEGLAIELRTGWRRGELDDGAPPPQELCLPSRLQPLDDDAFGRSQLAIDSWLREPAEALPRREPADLADLDLAARRMERIEGALGLLTELMLWPGIRRRRLEERLMLLTQAGLALEVPAAAAHPGQAMELELLLPLPERSQRVRAAARVERLAPELGAGWAVLRFETLDPAGQELLARYLYLVERSRRRRTPQREAPQLEAPRPVPPRRPSGDEAALRDAQWQPRRETRSSAARSRSQEELLAEVFEAMQALYGMSRLEECLTFAVDLLLGVVGCEAAVGFQVEGDGSPWTRVSAVVARGARVSRVQGRSFSTRGSLVQMALREGLPVSSSESDRDRRLFADVDCLLGADTRSCLCLPLTFEARSFGAIMLLNRRDEGPWSAGELSLASYVASRLAEYIAESLTIGVEDWEVASVDLDFGGGGSKMPLHGARPQGGAALVG